MSSVASLLDSQLTPKQQQLLAAILYPVIRQDLNEAATWSQWSFARSTLRKEQLDADQIATSLPRLDATLEFPEYGLIWRDTPMASSQIQRREKVGLTMAGLYRTDPDSADRIARLIGWCADREDALEPDPDGMTEESLDFNSMLTNCLAGQLRFGNGSLNAQTVADVLMREPIRVQVLITSGQWIYRLPIGDGDPTVCRCDRRSRIPTRPGTGRWTRPRRLRQRSIKQHIRAAAKPHDTAAARSSRNASCRADCSSSPHGMPACIKKLWPLLVRSSSPMRGGRVGREDLYGSQVWNQVFSTSPPDATHPRLRWPGSPSDLNVQNMNSGLRDFAKGVQLTIRNTATHHLHPLDSSEAIEHLASLSLLARWVDRCDVRLEPDDRQDQAQEDPGRSH